MATPTANTYHYAPLSDHGNIRLLRLIPHQDKLAPIHCHLFEYPLGSLGHQTAHLYEALSYAWGSGTDPLPLYIQGPLPPLPTGRVRGTGIEDNRCLNITRNLHAALTHIRDPYFDRVLWVDAVCINQQDNAEKGRQVQSMAKIYASASRVIVWLGLETRETAGALEALCKAASKKPVSTKAQKAIPALLRRPWFQRIWVRY